ncbi:hypothetical protein CMI37_35025 [Candidatus Pacearchaeota archaeon]|nr:hypothetical protein [Candidatus Pacearchaeota archaeon]|tara:strand:+ start:49 stop:228 length:180 start_codon:yes stop_codon:yes gene_type:complete
MVKHKIVRIRWSTWRALRHSIKGKSGETFTDYMERVSEKLKWADAQEFAFNELKGGNDK